MAARPGPLFLAAGFFDGVHRGHQRVIAAAREDARAAGGAIWVLTFDAHPRKVLKPCRAPLLLTSSDHKASLLAGLGVDGCLSLPFDRAWASLEPTEFLERLLLEAPNWSALYIGRGWRFGRRAAGDTALLRRWAGRKGITVKTVSPSICGGLPVSSTRIRAAVVAGRLSLASRMLGRPFSLWGRVSRGRGLGRSIGFPTANLEAENEVRPPPGVYVAAVGLDDGNLAGAVLNRGHRPTLLTERQGAGGPTARAAAPVIEAHLFDTDTVLYGRRVEIFLFERLRAERRFADLGALAGQIGVDARRARRIIAQKKYLKALQKTFRGIHYAPR